MSFYRKLDPSKPEIRVLIFVEPPEGSTELAHCELEHVLLDDFTEDFKDFLATREDGADKSEQAVREDWMRASMAQFPGHQATSQNFIKLPIWRQQIQDAGQNRSSQPWQQILEDSGTNIGPRCFLPDDIDQALKYSIAINHTSPWDRSPALPDKSCTPDKPGSRYFAHRPRYNWGDYEAVSYCWESEELDGKMVLEGTVIPITKNLSALLKQLRKSPDAKSGMKFWIDALCIDQGEIMERSQQVKLMKRIYKSAFAVLVWLGESNANSDEAIDFISRLSVSIMQKKEEWRGLSAMSEEDFDGWFQHFWDTTNLANMPWWSFFQFFSGNYWSRLWIIQELALNHNMTLFLCGNRQVSREMIQITCGVYLSSSSMITKIMMDDSFKSTAKYSVQNLWHTIYNINSLIRIDDGTGARENVDVTLDLGRRAKATDARDKVYGLLGLLPPVLENTILPDYTLNQKQVYTRFSRTMLETYKRLDSIFCGCLYDPANALPTWMPDWTAEFPRNRIRWLKEWNACSNTQALWSISAHNGNLTCRGFVVDFIVSTSKSMVESLPYMCCHSMSPLSRVIRFHRYDGPEGLKAALSRTLVLPPKTEQVLSYNWSGALSVYWIDWSRTEECDSESLCDRVSDIIGSDITGTPQWQAFEQFRQTNADFDIFGQSFRSFFPLVDSQPQISAPDPWFVTTTVIALSGRRLATTINGYLALIPEATQVGDVVAIVYGCNFPVILRQMPVASGNTYSVIGEAYIDGMMKGEMIAALERGEFKAGDFVFC